MPRIKKTKEEMLLEKIFGKQLLRPRIEFLIDKHKDYNTIHFYLNGVNMYLYLSDIEWSNLEKFLLETLKAENLPKGCQGFNGVDIPSGRIHYYDSEFQENMFNKLGEKGKWDKERYERAYADIKRETNYVKKHKLTEEINLSKNNIDICLKRKKFIRFREEFLKQK